MSRSGPYRIVINTFGSLGDLHPYLELAQGLKARGHLVVIATQPSFETNARNAGAGFYAAGPDIAELGDETALMAKAMHARKGPEFLIREIVMPMLRRGYQDILAATEGADVLITHPITMAATLLAERQAERLTWVSSVLAPSSFWSAHDPAVLAPAQWLARLRFLGPRFHRLLLRTIKESSRSWVEPWHELRRELGLPETQRHPIMDGQFSPTLTLALYSKLLGEPQPDWPPNSVMTGFLFYDQATAGAALQPELEEFLAAGPPPILFTLGTSAVMDAGDFYTQSAEAAARLGRRAVLLIGRDARNRPTRALPEGVMATEYAPYSLLMPRTAAIVHQGGVGTTAEALRAGKPMLVLPFGYDQPDNAARVARLGVARVISRRGYRAKRVAAELKELLENPSYAARAAEAATTVRGEDAVLRACEAIERVMAGRTVTA